ncbi:sensor domain-containing diguanylate cyclase [Omnitrophica bacterium]|nr:sensor domain-containing diguanylate cyclase [Candidatus Omnitrophota bacterium]
MYKLITNPWAYTIYLNIFLIMVIFAVFLYKRKLLWIVTALFVLFGFVFLFFKVQWQPVVLGYLTVCMIPLIFAKIRMAFNNYKEALTQENIIVEKNYNELVSEEGVIYDTQLKVNEKLAQISSLYEITKDLSTSLRYADIFKILAGYLQKTFLFRCARLILMSAEEETPSGNIVFETRGLEDNTARAKGIFPKLEISQRALDEHDRKVYDLLKNDIRRLQIVKTQWDQNPYIQFLPAGAKTYMAVPMIIENRLVGILAIEDLPTSDFEKFSILAAQCALQMRRIILYERVEEMAITDGLTKAFAKRHIMERLGEEFERSVRRNFNLSFIMVDIDYFKNYNDTYGHLVGDVVLRDIVLLLKSNTREVDLVGRFGGEEFCVILPETKKEEAFSVSKRIRDVVEKHRFKAYDESTDVTVSLGVATYPDDCKDVDELIENSDRALYTAKSAGRNKVCTYTP